ncbi:zinc finger protein 1-like [Ixodes scapularis]|nr:zinc finger protein 1-like [Ixodes scapularis]
MHDECSMCAVSYTGGYGEPKETVRAVKVEVSRFEDWNTSWSVQEEGHRSSTAPEGRAEGAEEMSLVAVPRQNFGCGICNQPFPSRELLLRHRRRAHNRMDGRVECRYCSYSSNHMATLDAHERKHTGEKPFGCGTCGKTFTRKSSLNLHMKTHMQRRPFGCDSCGRRFTQKVHLICHQRQHTGEAPYECDRCKMRFKNSSGLRSHKIKQHPDS